MRLAAKHKLPILPRGGGTSLSGQTVGHAIHIDFSKHMNRILECNVEEGWVRVQPGVVQDELNAFLRPKGFHLGPDTASSSRRSIMCWRCASSSVTAKPCCSGLFLRRNSKASFEAIPGRAKFTESSRLWPNNIGLRCSSATPE
ncbi:MAG: FAD-dependent oxidoreductase [Acidobacteriota bacterium]